MYNWEKFMKHHHLKKKKDFYSHLNVEHITDAIYAHAKRVCKDFETKDYENIMIFTFRVIHYC